MTLKGKVVIVTGGGQGIVRCIVKTLLEEGMSVTIAELDKEAGEEAVAKFGSIGAVRFVETDVAVESSVVNALESTIETFGRLDALINNAAIANPLNKPVEELPLEDWNRTVATNLTGYFLCTKHSVPHLRKHEGSIVNIASTRAFQSEPNTEAYAATKGGVVSLTHALAVSLGPEIRVNCISPGWIDVTAWKKSPKRNAPELTSLDHQQHPVGRVGRPEDITSLAAFLISDRAGFITGQNFTGVSAVVAHNR
jgi:NAD(P)-dependent dehydrogenase (short-subunit alcohol dehydrogenase family)